MTFRVSALVCLGRMLRLIRVGPRCDPYVPVRVPFLCPTCVYDRCAVTRLFQSVWYGPRIVVRVLSYDLCVTVRVL